MEKQCQEDRKKREDKKKQQNQEEKNKREKEQEKRKRDYQRKEERRRRQEWNRLKRKFDEENEQLRRKRRQLEREEHKIQKKKEENQKILPVYLPQVPYLPFCYTGQVEMSFPPNQLPASYLPYTGVPQVHYCQVTQPAIGVAPTASPPSSQVVAAPGG